MRSFVTRWKGALLRVSLAPLSFLGVGLYRAWLATFFRFGAYPTMGFGDYALFEGSIGVMSIVAALLARRISPLWSNTRACALTVALATGGAAVCALGCFVAPLALVKQAGLVLAGLGLGLLIIMWCEFYGALNPMRVAIYHAASIFFGELLCWLFMGLATPYLVAFSLLLPAVSVGWAHRAMLSLPQAERPGRPQAGACMRPGAIPWKPIALMATCTFAMQFGTMPDQPIVIGNVAGTLAATAFVFFGSLSTSRWFNFDTIYRVAFPFVTAACLLATQLLSDSPQLAALCFDAGYTMLSMFIMIVLSNITYRFGINAVWLNGIERGIRYLVECLGWVAYVVTTGALAPRWASVVGLAVTAVVGAMFLVIVLSEKSLSAKWGINLHEDDARDPLSPANLSLRVSELSKSCGLSDREEEVLQLMARKTPVKQMEEILFVAQGTIKAHTSRIYRKLGVHSREELFELLGVKDEPAE